MTPNHNHRPFPVHLVGEWRVRSITCIADMQQSTSTGRGRGWAGLLETAAAHGRDRHDTNRDRDGITYGIDRGGPSVKGHLREDGHGDGDRIG